MKMLKQLWNDISGLFKPLQPLPPPIIFPVENPSEIRRSVGGKEYSILLTRVEPFTPIRLENGEWMGLVYHYGRTKLVEEDDCARLEFDYYVVDNPDVLKVSDMGRFNDYIGEILADIIDHNLSDDPSKIPIMSNQEVDYLADSRKDHN